MDGSRVFVVAALAAAFVGALVWDRLHRPEPVTVAARPPSDRHLLLALGGGRAPRVAPRHLHAAPSPRRPLPVPPRRPAAPLPAARSYSVKPGDSLSGIAHRTLGDARRWREIVDLNGIDCPDLIRPGQELRIP